MRLTTIVYYAAAIVLLFFFMSLALPFLKNLLPGMKLGYSLFPAIFILLTHYKPKEILQSFKLAGHRSRGTKADYRNALLFFRTAQNIFIVLMLIGLPIMAIWLLAGPQSTPPQIAHIVAMVIGLFLYPLLFILFLCLPFKSALEKKMNENELE